MEKKRELNIIVVLLVSYLLFLLYVTHKPFWLIWEPKFIHIQVDKLLSSITRFSSIISQSRGDILANIILFIPYGFIIVWYLEVKIPRKNTFKKYLFAFFLILGTTVFIEFTQLFNLKRFPSIVDVINNTLGGIVGVGLYVYVKNYYNHHLIHIQKAFPRNWNLQLLFFMIIAYILYQTLPLDIQLSRWVIKKHLTITFDADFKLSEFFNAIPAGLLLAFISDLLMNVTFFHQSGSMFDRLVINIGILIGVIFFTYAFQMICNYRYTSFSEMMFILLIFLILVVRMSIFYLRKGTYFIETRKSMMILFRRGLWIYSIFIVTATLFPLSFHQNITARMKEFIVPFHDYSSTDQMIIILDFFKDIFKYFFLSVLISLYLTYRGKRWSRKINFFFMSALIFLEFLQLFNKIYTPDISDIVLGFIGFFIGRKVYLMMENYIGIKMEENGT